jgi:hypothetical protein
MFMQNVCDLMGDVMQEISEIPTFDLAEQIMAEHRKATAVKRKGPGKMARPPKKQHPAESITRNVMLGQGYDSLLGACCSLYEPQESSPEALAPAGPQQVIAEIVARDIENLCLGNISLQHRLV